MAKKKVDAAPRGGSGANASPHGAEVTADALAARIGERGLDPLYLLEGAEAFLRERALADIRRLGGGGSPVPPQESAFEGAKAVVADVLDELRTLPFLASARLVRVTDADKFLVEHAEDLDGFLDQLAARPAGPARCTLVLETEGLDGRLRVSRRVRELAVRVPCDSPDESGLLRFVKERARARGFSFERGADGALLERFAGGAGVKVDLGILESEVAKLCDAAAAVGSTTITLERVLAIASGLTAEDTFAVVGAVGRGDARGALESLRAVFRDGAIVDGERKREPKAVAPMLLGLLAWDLGRVFKGRALLDQGRSGQDVVSECKAWRDREAFLARVRATTPESLRRAHELLREADARLKEAGEPQEILTTLVARLALAAPRARAGRDAARAGTR